MSRGTWPLMHMILLHEWEVCSTSQLQTEYDLGDSWYYKDNKGKGQGLALARHPSKGLFNND